MRASVIVLNYNGLRYLDVCFAALREQHLSGGFEIIMVDNASTDGSVEHVLGRHPEVRVVEAGTNLGFAAGNNLGMDQAMGTHLVLLNNDTRPRPGWLEALVAAAESGDRVGAVTSKIVYLNRPDVLQNTGSLLLSDGSGGDRGTGEEDRGQYDAPEEVFGACGCAVLLSRPMLADVGSFDDSFFAYYEDLDLSWRMRLRGWRVLYEPQAVVEHVHSGTSVEWSPFFIFHVDRNRLFMIIKNAPPGFVLRAFAGFGLLAGGTAASVVLRRAGRSSGGDAAAPGPFRTRIHMRVLASVVVHLPEMLRKRWGIRHSRRIADREIMRWLYPRDEWNAR
jgi:GT2 family glycosyltransferase